MVAPAGQELISATGTIAGCHARLECAQHGRVANGVTRNGRASGWTGKSPVKEPRTWKHEHKITR
jgi:hypothetical protein